MKIPQQVANVLYPVKIFENLDEYVLLIFQFVKSLVEMLTARLRKSRLNISTGESFKKFLLSEHIDFSGKFAIVTFVTRDCDLGRFPCRVELN